jgi:hypothetical protein
LWPWGPDVRSWPRDGTAEIRANLES